VKAARNAYYSRYPILDIFRKQVETSMKSCVFACLLALAAAPAGAQSGHGVSLAALSTQPSMNVFRRFAVDPAKMASFYSEVLGLKQLPSLNMPGGGQMMLFEIGSGQVKLQFTAAASEYKTGPVRDVTGLRVFTFFYPDEAAVTARFVQRGHPAPAFRPARGNRRVAMVLDPADHWVEIVIAQGDSPDV
jgi:hypothetical protein